MGFGVIQCVVAHHPSEVGSTRGWLHDPSYSIHSAISLLVWKRASSWKEPNGVFSMDHVMSVDPDLSKISRIFSGPSSHAQLHGVLDPLNSPSAPTLHATALSLFRMYLLYVERHSNESWCSCEKGRLTSLEIQVSTTKSTWEQLCIFCLDKR